MIAADSTAEAEEQFRSAQRRRVSAMLGRGRTLTDEEADLLLDTPAGQQVRQMGRYSAVGTPAEVRDFVDAFVSETGVDEVIVAGPSPSAQARLRSFELLAQAMDLVAAPISG